ncbi:SDR family NAD(P)-dependent oxidoreductase [Pseudosporangium ferrugineum]|uniref:Meso-butanediol dehydrogenase/(S,S)-butanediol dehydrogenase/diacetyl reductase n=1 Tax=Pseudosporangium ferrugineum TaxID=439699 RepID=A0A2T0SD82_9ACTN|nr:SDR family oxidoreductase [Pseudosporangium ferrugineum]PRY31283.1 meso-butanediol dehydrogenase/(S,S)-butanediol dehydrogenase/diacetyl reductase [Pseudosporangium ferrugineum]
MEQRFKGKTVIVTGSSSGIGVGIARRFAAEGADVVLAARRRDRLDALAAELGAYAVTTDVTREEDVRAMVRAAVDRFGRLDVLVSNAGAGLLKEFAETTIDDWRAAMATNVESCFFGAQAALPHLRNSHGNIVHIASASGLGGDRRMTAYNAAKGAVVNFTRGLAFDLGQDDVRVNTVAPALTLPDDAAPQYQGLIDKFNQRRAVKRYATPADVAAAVAFLASADARMITGAILPVDGGITAASGQPPLF